MPNRGRSHDGLIHEDGEGALAGEEDDCKRYAAALGAHYAFSKRTMGYAIASYAKGAGLLDTDATQTNRVVTTVGVTHWF